MRRVLEFLKKIGVVRVGGQAAVYTNTQERPLEFTRDDMDPTPPSASPSPERTPDR
jgi:hypothetical protein